LFGLEAISAHNGWVISFLGITIVFTGLTVLSLFISQLHKALDLWDKKAIFLQRIKTHFLSSDTRSPIVTERSPAEIHQEIIRQYKMLIDTLEEPFPLPKLLELAKNRGLYHPFAAINSLIQKGIIKPDGEGYFFWEEPTRLKAKK